MTKLLSNNGIICISMGTRLHTLPIKDNKDYTKNVCTQFAGSSCDSTLHMALWTHITLTHRSEKCDYRRRN